MSTETNVTDNRQLVQQLIAARSLAAQNREELPRDEEVITLRVRCRSANLTLPGVPGAQLLDVGEHTISVYASDLPKVEELAHPLTESERAQVEALYQSDVREFRKDNPTAPDSALTCSREAAAWKILGRELPVLEILPAEEPTPKRRG